MVKTFVNYSLTFIKNWLNGNFQIRSLWNILFLQCIWRYKIIIQMHLSLHMSTNTIIQVLAHVFTKSLSSYSQVTYTNIILELQKIILISNIILGHDICHKNVHVFIPLFSSHFFILFFHRALVVLHCHLHCNKLCSCMYI